jgi:hypothetical protein
MSSVKKTTDPGVTNVNDVIDHNADILKTALTNVDYNYGTLVEDTVESGTTSTSIAYPKNGVVAPLGCEIGFDLSTFVVNVSAGVVQIDNTVVTTPVPNVSVPIPAPDTTYDRIDAVQVDTAGTVTLKQGSPGSEPVGPVPDTDNVIIAYILVPANYPTNDPNTPALPYARVNQLQSIRYSPQQLLREYKEQTNAVNFKDWIQFRDNDGKVNFNTEYVFLRQGAGPYTVSLPGEPPTGWKVTIKDIEGFCGTDNITIDTDEYSGSVLIEGQATYTFDQDWQGATFLYTGENYVVI